jgi:hypothetical protein
MMDLREHEINFEIHNIDKFLDKLNIAEQSDIQLNGYHLFHDDHSTSSFTKFLHPVTDRDRFKEHCYVPPSFSEQQRLYEGFIVPTYPYIKQKNGKK